MAHHPRRVSEDSAEPFNSKRSHVEGRLQGTTLTDLTDLAHCVATEHEGHKNVIDIVENAQYCLVYDRLLAEHGFIRREPYNRLVKSTYSPSMTSPSALAERRTSATLIQHHTSAWAVTSH